jgi:hypothetical protein
MAMPKFPWSKANLNRILLSNATQNVTATFAFVQKLSQAKNFQDVVKNQTEFMETQMKSFNEQARVLSEIYAKAQDAMKGALERQCHMTRFYEPDLTTDPDSPFVRDASNKLVRRSYWMDMTDKTLVMVMTQGIGAHLTNDEERAHLTDLKRDYLIDHVCVQEILPPEK